MRGLLEQVSCDFKSFKRNPAKRSEPMAVAFVVSCRPSAAYPLGRMSISAHKNLKIEQKL